MDFQFNNLLTRMFIRERCISSISYNLAIIERKLKIGNSLNLLDSNLHAEDFFKGLLNKVYRLNLKNLNYEKRNSIAIDLADEKAGFAFQVTSSKSLKKIKETVEKYHSAGLHKKYSHFKILVIDTPTARSGTIEYDGFDFDLSKDVLSASDVIREIKNFDNVHEIEAIDNWISHELGIRGVKKLQPTQKDFDEYFGRFLLPDSDPVKLLLLAQPTLADCREVFSDEYFIQVYHFYSHQYLYLVEQPDSDLKMHHLIDEDEFRVDTSTYADIKSGTHNLPGGINSIYENNAFRPGKLQYHTVRFVQSNKEHGISFKVWVFLNGRWVFFPKPWGIVETIKILKNDSGIKNLIKFLKLFGLNKSLAEYEPVTLISYLLRELMVAKN